MKHYAFRILNVFAREDRLSGNPLCVFENGEGLDEAQMQAIARQFNLSETTFILPSTEANARVRIFTPSHAREGVRSSIFHSLSYPFDHCL
jgi:trans-2,3-dihydro-3-hydroxyanthranilate isomerase